MGHTVRHTSIPADTSPEVFALMVDRWRRMGIAGRAELVQRLCLDAECLARAGIAALHPELTEIEICQELTRRRYGDELADAAYETLLAR